MAFTDATLTLIGGESAASPMPRLWTYLTADAAATVDSAGYFTGGKTTQFRLGDLILRVTADSATAPTSISTSGMHVVTAVGATIDVNDAVSLMGSDTD